MSPVLSRRNMESLEIKVSIEKCKGTACKKSCRERCVNYRETEFLIIWYDDSSSYWQPCQKSSCKKGKLFIFSIYFYNTTFYELKLIYQITNIIIVYNGKFDRHYHILLKINFLWCRKKFPNLWLYDLFSYTYRLFLIFDYLFQHHSMFDIIMKMLSTEVIILSLCFNILHALIRRLVINSLN